MSVQVFRARFSNVGLMPVMSVAIRSGFSIPINPIKWSKVSHTNDVSPASESVPRFR